MKTWDPRILQGGLPYKIVVRPIRPSISAMDGSDYNPRNEQPRSIGARIKFEPWCRNEWPHYNPVEHLCTTQFPNSSEYIQKTEQINTMFELVFEFFFEK